MKSKALFEIVLAVGFFALAVSVACDEMGLAEDAGILVEEEALESTCVCRVDSDMDTSGDGKTWDTAMKTVEECVEVLEKDTSESRSCEIWLKEGTVDGTYHLDTSHA